MMEDDKRDQLQSGLAGLQEKAPSADSLKWEQLQRECQTLYAELAALRETASRAEENPETNHAHDKIRDLALLLDGANHLLTYLQKIIDNPDRSENAGKTTLA